MYALFYARADVTEHTILAWMPVIFNWKEYPFFDRDAVTFLVSVTLYNSPWQQ
jgi:hypothetical protein